MRSKAQTQQAVIAAPVLTGLLQRQCACGQHTVAGDECAECARRSGDAGTLVREVLSAPGEPLDPELRAFMEPRFNGDFTRIPSRVPAPPDLAIGRADDPLESAAESAAERALTQDPRDAPGVDFSGVVIHRGVRAAAAARALNARAFTVGSHIVLGAGEYQPESYTGRRLLAHELAHVVQQTGPTLRRKDAPAGAVAKAPEAATDANDRQPGDPAGDDKAAAVKTAPDLKAPPPPPLAGGPESAAAKTVDNAPQPAPSPDKTLDAAKPAEPASVADLATGDLALVDKELAEHQRWGAASAKVGAAESSQRADFIAKKAGAESNLLGSAAEGAQFAIKIKIAEKVLGKVFLKVAVARLGSSAVKFTPVPGVGAMVGGAIAAYELANRDWKATGETIGKFGKGASYYDTLANSIEAVSTIIDVTTQVLNVIAGIIGAISFGMWAVSIVTLGVASPLAFTLSTIAGAIGIGSLVLDGINALVLKELVTIFRVLDAFTSEADPRDVVTQGDAIARSAGAATNFAGGFAGGAAVESGAKRLGGKKPPPTVPNHETPPPAAGEGSFVKAEPPAPGAQPATGAKPAAGAPAAAPAEVTAKPAATGKPAIADPAVQPSVPVAELTKPAEGGGKPPGGGGHEPPGGGGHEPPGGGAGGEPPAKKYGPIDERSFADLNDTVKAMDEGAFGDRLQAEAQRAQQPPPTAPAGTRYGRSAYSLLRRLLRAEEPGPPGTQAQHQTKWLASTRDIPNPLDRMTPQQISQNRMWLQTDPNRPATLLLTDPQGGGTRYYEGNRPAPRPNPQLDLFPSQQRPADPRFTTEHRFMDNSLIPTAADRIRANNPGGVNPNLVNLWAGAEARWQTQGIPGQGDWGWQPRSSAQVPTQLPLLPGFRPELPRAAAAPKATPPGQLSLNFDKPAAPTGQLDLFGQPAKAQPALTPEPGPAPQPGPAPEPSSATANADAPPPSTKQRVDAGPTPEQIKLSEDLRKIQAELNEQKRDAQAEQEMKQEEYSETTKSVARFALPSYVLPKSFSKKEEPEPEGPSQFSKNIDEFKGVYKGKLSLAESAMLATAGPAGVVAMRGAVKAHADPIIRHVNPNYPPPPCMPQDIVNLQNDILQALESRSQAEAVSTAMAAQQKHHQANEKPLTDMAQKTGEQITATEAHKQAVARRAEATGKKKDNEKKVESKIDHYSEEGGKLAALTIPMKGFKSFTGLAYSLPDEPDILVSVKRNLIRMNKDTTKFLNQLDQVDGTMKDHKKGGADRKKGIEDDANKLRDTDQKNGESNTNFGKAKETTEGLDKDNKARLDEAGKMKGEADRNAQALGADADQKKAKAQTMSAALQAWAQNHRKARQDSLQQTKEGLEKQGYKILEVKEL